MSKTERMNSTLEPVETRNQRSNYFTLTVILNGTSHHVNMFTYVSFTNLITTRVVFVMYTINNNDTYNNNNDTSFLKCLYYFGIEY